MRLTFLMLLLLLASCTEPQPAFAYSDEALCQAIYQAEGGSHTRWPYGVKSVKVSSVAKARRVCLTSIRRSRARWVTAGRPGDWLTYFGKRYSPPAQNPDWVKLVHWFLSHPQ